jgi:hypothetical protein
MSLLKRDLKEVLSNLFLLKDLLVLFIERGTDVLPDVGTSDQQIMQNRFG